jgi:hypothetical protein
MGRYVEEYGGCDVNERWGENVVEKGIGLEPVGREKGGVNGEVYTP